MSMPSLSISITDQLILVAVVAGLLYLGFSRKKLNLPPGPTGLPLVGNLLDFRGSTLTKKTLEWKGKYGDVVRYRLGLKQWVVLSSIEAMTEAYIQRGVDFASKPQVPSLLHFSSGGNNIAFAPYSEALRYRRKIAMQAIRQYIAGSQHTERIHLVIQETVRSLKTHKSALNPHSHFSYIIFNLIHDLAFGYSLSMEDPIYQDLLTFFDSRNVQIGGFWEDVFPILMYCPTPKFRQVTGRIKQFIEYVGKHVRERQKIFHENSVETLIDHILLAQKQVDQSEDEALKAGFTDLHIIQMIRDVFIAGFSTSRHTLDWFFLLMAANQDVQNKIHEEIDSIVGNQVPDREHKPGLVFTEAVIMEVMRLFPVTPMGLPHETLCNTKVKGYDIPAKTTVLINQFAILHDPRHWEDPEKFYPERFLEDGGTKVKTRPKSWIPFSAGHRSCIGEVLARQNILYSVVGLLQKLHFDLPPGSGAPNLTPENMWFDLRARPYQVVVSSRQ